MLPGACNRSRLTADPEILVLSDPNKFGLSPPSPNNSKIQQNFRKYIKRIVGIGGFDFEGAQFRFGLCFKQRLIHLGARPYFGRFHVKSAVD